MKKPSVAVLAYLAGILDGEGCIYVNRRKAHGRRKTVGYSVKVVVSITAGSLVEWLKNHAALTSIHYVENPGPNRKPKWLLTWNNSKAEWLLRSVRPYLVIKTEQAALGLELLEHLRQPIERGKIVSDENIRYRESIKQKIGALNRRGRIAGSTSVTLM